MQSQCMVFMGLFADGCVCSALNSRRYGYSSFRPVAFGVLELKTGACSGLCSVRQRMMPRPVAFSAAGAGVYLLLVADYFLSKIISMCEQ